MQCFCSARIAEQIPGNAAFDQIAVFEAGMQQRSDFRNYRTNERMLITILRG